MLPTWVVIKRERKKKRRQKLQEKRRRQHDAKKRLKQRKKEAQRRRHRKKHGQGQRSQGERNQSQRMQNTGTQQEQNTRQSSAAVVGAAQTPSAPPLIQTETVIVDGEIYHFPTEPVDGGNGEGTHLGQPNSSSSNSAAAVGFVNPTFSDNETSNYPRNTDGQIADSFIFGSPIRLNSYENGDIIVPATPIRLNSESVDDPVTPTRPDFSENSVGDTVLVEEQNSNQTPTDQKAQSMTRLFPKAQLKPKLKS